MEREAAGGGGTTSAAAAAGAVAIAVFICFAFSVANNLRNNLTLNKSANLINLWAFCGCLGNLLPAPESAPKYAVHVIAFCCCSSVCMCESVCALFVRVSGWPVPACCSTCILVNLTLLNYAQHSRMEGGGGRGKGTGRCRGMGRGRGRCRGVASVCARSPVCYLQI